MATAGTNLEKAVMLAVTSAGGRLFRNVRGVFYRKGDFEQKFPIKVGAGPNGGSDLIGFVPVLVTPDMVGQTLAVFTAIECKAGRDTVKKEQADFIGAVRRFGGRAGVARNSADAIKILVDGTE